MELIYPRNIMEVKEARSAMKLLKSKLGNFLSQTHKDEKHVKNEEKQEK